MPAFTEMVWEKPEIEAFTSVRAGVEGVGWIQMPQDKVHTVI
jgi:hypothetical protein